MSGSDMGASGTGDPGTGDPGTGDAGTGDPGTGDAGTGDAGTTEVTIKVRADGPLKVTGPVTLVDHEGRRFEVAGDDLVLCRCGHSADKPFCDGTHRHGFDGTCARQTGG